MLERRREEAKARVEAKAGAEAPVVLAVAPALPLAKPKQSRRERHPKVEKRLESLRARPKAVQKKKLQLLTEAAMVVKQLLDWWECTLSCVSSCRWVSQLSPKTLANPPQGAFASTLGLM